MNTPFPPAPMKVSLETILSLDIDLWNVELKKNGMRLTTINDDGVISFKTRQLKTVSLSKGVAQLMEITRNLPIGSVIEGEWQQQEGILYLFDVLAWKGPENDSLTYQERHNMLKIVVAELDNPNNVQLMPSLDEMDDITTIAEFYNHWMGKDFAEGVVVKKRNSLYDINYSKTQKTHNWLKRRYSWDNGLPVEYVGAA